MKALSLTDKCRVAGAWLWVKLGKLTSDQFSENELTELLSPHLPITVDVKVPVGKASLRCVSGEIVLPANTNELQLNLFNEFHIHALGNPLYRAHILAVITAIPHYNVGVATLEIEQIELRSLSLVKDEYSFVKDTSTLLSALPPLSVAQSLANPLKNLVNTVTAGLSNSAIGYLEGFTLDNKQKLLDQHKPAIEQALHRYLATIDTQFTMRQDNWREYLFSQLGKRVSVCDRQLKFWFS